MTKVSCTRLVALLLAASGFSQPCPALGVEQSAPGVVAAPAQPMLDYGGGRNALARALSERTAPPTSVAAQVGELGGVEHLLFEGVETFTPQDIRAALRMDPDFLLSSHGTAPLSGYLDTVQKLITAGYMQGGFPNVVVSATLDAGQGQIVVKVQEGRRYLAGAVEVKGAKSFPADQIIRRLTEPYPPAEDTIPVRGDSGSPKRRDRSGREVETQPPAWVKGKPASFYPATIKRLRMAITNALADTGCLFPEIKVAVVPNTNTGLANLAVEIVDEGPRAKVDQIEVIGNQKNSREAMLKFVGLERGMPITQQLLADAELKLWQSGRFLGHTVSPERIGPDASDLKIRLDVMENEDAPALSADLSPKEQALLRFRNWLSAFRERNQDLAITCVQGPWQALLDVGFELLLSPSGGLLLTFENKKANPPAAGRHYIVLSGEQAAWSSPGRRARFAFTNPVQASAHVAFRTERDRQKPYNLELGAGFKFGLLEREPFKLDVLLAPAAMLGLAYKTNLTSEIAGNQLVVRSKVDTNAPDLFRVEAASGRLVEFHMVAYRPDGSKGLNVSARFEKGLLQKRLEEVAATSAGQPNLFARQRPMSSWSELLAGELAQGEWLRELTRANPAAETLRRVGAVVLKFLNRETLEPVDRVLAGFDKPEPELFQIPPDQPENVQQALGTFAGLTSALVFRYCDDFFPKHSWPWTVAREAVFVLKGQTQYTDSELQRLYNSPETGPLGFWTISRLLTRIHSPAARPFATRGLVRLSTEDFRKDYRLLLEGNSALAQAISNAARSLGNLEEAQIDDLVSALPPETARFIRHAARLIREDRNGPPATPLGKALDEYWERFLRDQVRSALMDLIRASQPSAQA